MQHFYKTRSNNVLRFIQLQMLYKLTIATHSDRSRSWSNSERTTGVGSMQCRTVICLVTRRSVSPSDRHVTYSRSRWTTPFSGGVPPSKQRRDTSSIKNMLQRSLYASYRCAGSLWNIGDNVVARA